VPTPISHAAVGFAVAAWTQRGVPSRRVCAVAAACAALPDIDVLGWPLHASPASSFAHRGITHSLAFCVVGALVVTLACFRGPVGANRRGRIGLILGLALLSHVCLDALSTYSAGVEFFAPISRQRFRFPWTPLGDPTGGMTGQLVQDAVWVLLPAVLLGWLAFTVRRYPPSGAMGAMVGRSRERGD
jgi:inner membrane protein